MECNCNTCRQKTTEVGHLCDPKTITKKTKVYECLDCGILSTEQHLLCKPKILRLK